MLDYDVYALDRGENAFVLAKITGATSDERINRPPLNLSLVLDRSGSMAGDKLEYVKQAAAFLVQHLTPRDRLSLVTYDHMVDVIMASSFMTYKDQYVQAINAIRAGGSTNLSGGWMKGCQLVEAERTEGGVNRVLLLTDGLANQGITDHVRLGKMAAGKRSEGVTTTTMGVGMGFNEDLLTRMSSNGGGAFYFIDNPDQAPAIFQEELTDLLNVVGQNLVITVMLEAGVKLLGQLTNYTRTDGVSGSEYWLGDLFAEEEKIFLIELALPEHDDEGEVQVGSLRFEYDELGEETVQHRVLDLPIMVNVKAVAGLEGRNRNDEVAKSVYLLQAARAREQAVDYADKGDFHTASRTLSNIADAIQQAGIDDPDLQREHDMLREEAVDMEIGESRYDSHARKTSVTKTMYSMRGFEKSAQSAGTHNRMKASREAVERSGPAPSWLAWRKESLALGDAPLRIGRASDNEVVVNDEEASGYHCEIIKEGDAYFLQDVGSLNGTYANGGRLEGRFRLSVGDVFTVAGTLFMLHGNDFKPLKPDAKTHQDSPTE